MEVIHWTCLVIWQSPWRLFTGLVWLLTGTRWTGFWPDSCIICFSCCFPRFRIWIEFWWTQIKLHATSYLMTNVNAMETIQSIFNFPTWKLVNITLRNHYDHVQGNITHADHISHEPIKCPCQVYIEDTLLQLSMSNTEWRGTRDVWDRSEGTPWRRFKSFR